MKAYATTGADGGRLIFGMDSYGGLKISKTSEAITATYTVQTWFGETTLEHLTNMPSAQWDKLARYIIHKHNIRNIYEKVKYSKINSVYHVQYKTFVYSLYKGSIHKSQANIHRREE